MVKSNKDVPKETPVVPADLPEILDAPDGEAIPSVLDSLAEIDAIVDENPATIPVPEPVPTVLVPKAPVSDPTHGGLAPSVGGQLYKGKPLKENFYFQKMDGMTAKQAAGYFVSTFPTINYNQREGLCHVTELMFPAITIPEEYHVRKLVPKADATTADKVAEFFPEA